MPERVFICQKCGRCCEGKGGIVLSASDIARLAAHIAMEEAEFIAQFVETSSGKPKIKSGTDGFCVFYQKDAGCGVHKAKPDVCRAWPFFRGNLVDAYSLDLAREFCDGIRKDVPFEEFAAVGRAWLVREKLARPDGPANALRYPEDGESN